jgi:hypothetical protein
MHNFRTELSMPELHMSSRALMPVAPAVAELSLGRPNSLLHHPAVMADWRRRGEVCPQPTVAADVQGGRIAGFGAYDVTDTKFSIRLGPPSCSPPV